MNNFSSKSSSTGSAVSSLTYRSGSGIRLSFETPIESHEIVWWRYELGIQ